MREKNSKSSSAANSSGQQPIGRSTCEYVDMCNLVPEELRDTFWAIFYGLGDANEDSGGRLLIPASSLVDYWQSIELDDYGIDSATSEDFIAKLQSLGNIYVDLKH
jgi:hypothetical protein